ncbi:hypothetical protein ABZ915_04630 [Streptomyces sp. NPDC046915]|uniref:hypothetical protein n=1 Tax=Streptomyces sp. NPDC046915 TaxID=3155257 RepID=UPI0033EBC0D6
MSRLEQPQNPRKRWPRKYGTIVVIVLVVPAAAEQLDERQYAALLVCLGALLPALMTAA